jgi:hypothetical protein
MTWVKLPQEFADRSEIMMAGRDAAWLHTAALVYCAKFLTDGVVPAGAIYGLAMGPDAPELADKLVAVGLWYPVEGGYYVPDYLAWNPSREHKAELSASRAANGKAGGVRSGASRREAKSKQNASQIADQIGEQKRSKIEAKREASDEARIPYPVSRISASDRDHDPTPRAPENASARGDGAGKMTPARWSETWREFRLGYGKIPPRRLEARWPEFCPDEATWAAIQEGLAHWLKCRQWVENNPNGDYCDAAEAWLSEKRYLIHPPPWNPDTGVTNHEEHQGRAGGDATPRAKAYALGDNDDPYWAENHGLLSEVRQRKRDLAAGRAVPDDGRTGVGGTVSALPGRRVAQA